MATVINDGSIAPISSDLTKEDLKMQILRGWETMIREDVKLAASTSIDTGEWFKLDSSGKAAKLTSTAVAQSYLCIGGSDRFDVKATGQITYCGSRSNVVVKTSSIKTDDTYAVGDAVTAKLISSYGKLCKAGASEPILGRVKEVGASNAYLVVELQAPVLTPAS